MGIVLTTIGIIGVAQNDEGPGRLYPVNTVNRETDDL